MTHFENRLRTFIGYIRVEARAEGLAKTKLWLFGRNDSARLSIDGEFVVE